MARNEGASRALSAVVVVALVVVVSVLAVLALRHGSAPAPAATSSPSSPIDSLPTSPPPTDETTPTPSATPTDPPPKAEERFLAFNVGQVWRATAGLCDGDAPTVELSTDNGESWSDVTPSGVEQVLGLSSYGEVQAELITASDGCEPDLMRTYTAGVEWASYDALAAVTYISPADVGTVVTPNGDVDAPCERPTSTRSSRGAVGIVCDGVAYRLDGDDWRELVDDAIAMDAAGGVIVVAHLDEECQDGAAVTRFDAADSAFAGCFDDVDAAEPAALSVLGGEYVLWTGDALRRF